VQGLKTQVTALTAMVEDLRKQVADLTPAAEENPPAEAPVPPPGALRTRRTTSARQLSPTTPIAASVS
jgi:hypothetical protein